MHRLTLEQIAELREDLPSMRNRLTKQAEEQVRDSPDVNFQGGDKIDRANVEIDMYINLQRIERLKARPVITMRIDCKELEEEGENER